MVAYRGNPGFDFESREPGNWMAVAPSNPPTGLSTTGTVDVVTWPNLASHHRRTTWTNCLTKADHQTFRYKTGKIESSGAVLALRIVAGLPTGILAGFIGSIFNNIAVPTRSAGDVPAIVAPLVVSSLFAASGGMIVWFNRFETRRGLALLWAASIAGAILGASIAYYAADRYIGPLDLHILNQRLSQAVLFGAAVGANTIAVVVSLEASRRGK